MKRKIDLDDGDEKRRVRHDNRVGVVSAPALPHVECVQEVDPFRYGWYYEGYQIRIPTTWQEYSWFARPAFQNGHKEVRDLIGEYAARDFPRLLGSSNSPGRCCVCQKSPADRSIAYPVGALRRLNKSFHCGDATCMLHIQLDRRDDLEERCEMPLEWLDANVFSSQHPVQVLRSSRTIDPHFMISKMMLLKHSSAAMTAERSGLYVTMQLVSKDPDTMAWHDSSSLTKTIPLELCLQWNPQLWSHMKLDHRGRILEFPLTAEGRAMVRDKHQYSAQLYRRFLARFARIRTIHTAIRQGSLLGNALGNHIWSYLVEYPIHFHVSSLTRPTRIQELHALLLNLYPEMKFGPKPGNCADTCLLPLSATQRIYIQCPFATNTFIVNARYLHSSGVERDDQPPQTLTSQNALLKHLDHLVSNL